MVNRAASIEECERLLDRKGDRIAVLPDEAEHLGLGGQALVDIPDREDRPVVVPTPERIIGIRTADASVASNDGGVRVRFLPVAPGRGGDRQPGRG